MYMPPPSRGRVYIDFVSASLRPMQVTLINDREILALPPIAGEAADGGDTYIYIWCHAYGRAELTALANAAGRADLAEEFAGCRDKRFGEKVSVRLLLHQLLGREAKIVYNPDGSPRLADNSHSISVSHTAGAYALSLSPRKHGIDIEAWGAKALKVRRAFLNERESEWVESLSKSEAEQLATLLWSAKESLYKLLGAEGLSFKDQLSLAISRDGCLEATVRPGERRLTVECRRLPRFALTCCAESVSR